MTTEGFVKLPRTMLEWGWLDDGNTLKVYIVLLLSANWKDAEWHGIKVKRGQLITGRERLAKMCKLSVRQVRTALEHLKSTNDITIETTTKFSIITLNNYDSAELCGNETTNDRPTVDQQTSNDRPAVDQRLTTVEERKEEKEIKEKQEEKEAPASQKIPITREELINQYGNENVTLYETKFDTWAAKKGLSDFPNMYSVIAKWLAEDNVRKPQSSSFSMDSVMNKILERYRT